MSTPFRPSYLIFAVAVQILHFFTNAAAQDIEARIEITEAAPSIAYVSGRFTNGDSRNLSFVRSYTGFNDLGERIRDVTLKDRNGVAIAFQTAVPGEFVADTSFAEWSYSIDLTPRKEQASAASVSWIAGGRGLLMLNDILPLSRSNSTRTSAKLTLNTPVLGTVQRTVDDVRNEVISFGRGSKSKREIVGNSPINIEVDGDWLFSEQELADFCREVFSGYRNIFGADPQKEPFIRLIKFPNETPHGVWQADTRGANVTILSSDMPFKTQSLQRLHEQLRHEMFHLWIPNGVNLSGNYDWFYEGFALYASLKMAVSLNRIRFADFLDTLSRAQAIDARQTNRLSLIEASSKRWSGADTYVYARGMVTAFLCDILLLHNSKGKRSINDIVREFYAKHRYPNPRTDGNEASLAILQANNYLGAVIDRYIKNSEKFAWEPELQIAGLEAKNGLSVMAKLSGKQKDLLDGLGYNNWRKLPPPK